MHQHIFEKGFLALSHLSILEAISLLCPTSCHIGLIIININLFGSKETSLVYMDTLVTMCTGTNRDIRTTLIANTVLD